MSDDFFRRRYTPDDFPLLVSTIPESIELFKTAVALLTLVDPVSKVDLDFGGNAIVEWLSRPPDADLNAVDAAAAALVGTPTTSQPFVYESFGTSTSNSGTPVVKIDQTTPPLDAGTYQVSWSCSLRMQSVIANTGVQADITLTRSDGGSVHQDDAWDLANRHAYNGSQPFGVLAGQTIRAQLTFNRLGASGVAEMSGARVTIDKIS